MSKLVLRDNKQSKSMLSNDEITMNMEVPLKYKNFTQVPATNLSVGAVSFQATNLNSMIEANLYLQAEVTVVLKGQTISPSGRVPPAPAPPATMGGTPTTIPNGSAPSLWTMSNGGFENFCINKAVTQIDYDVGGCKWTESGRTAHLTDILTEQFPKEKKEAWGIYDQNPWAQLEQGYGSGLISDANWQVMVNYESTDANYNNNYLPLPWLNSAKEQAEINPFMKQFNSRYVRVKDVKFTTTEAGVVLDAKKDNFDIGFYVPMRSGDVDITYYTGTANTLTETIIFEVYEPIVSPYTSNPFTFHEYVKSYYAGSAFNLKLTFDEIYVKNMFKMGRLASTTTWSSSITKMDLCFYTFSSQRLISQKNKIIYYQPTRILQPQVMIPRGSANYAQAGQSVFANNLKSASVQVSTATLSYLPQYLLICPNIIKDVSGNSSTIMFAKTKKLSLKLGTNIDLLAGMTMEEIFLHSAEVMGQRRLFNLISGKERVKYAQDALVYIQAQQNNTVSSCKKSLLLFDYKQDITTSKCFIMLDIAKLNADGKLPYVDYGAPINGPNNSISLSIEVECPTFYAKPFFDLPDGQNGFTVEIDVYTFQKKIRILDHTNGRTEDHDIVFNYDQVQNQLNEYETEEYRGRQEDELMYIGGAWNFSNLEEFFNMVRPWIPAIAHTARAGINMINKRIQDNDDYSDNLKYFGKKASDGLEMLGYGGKGGRRKVAKYNP